MGEVRFDRMVPADVVARRGSSGLAYLPVGSLEWHGNHMPFGTDYFTVTHLAEEAARRLGGVVFPPIYYADVRYHLQESRAEWRKTYSRSMQVPETYAAAFPFETGDGPPEASFPTHPDDGPVPEDALEFTNAGQEREFARHIARVLLEIHLYGFKAILILPGHGPNPRYCSRAEEIYRENVLRRTVFGAPARTLTWFYINGAMQAGAEPMMGQHWLHADKWEGSVTMAAAPGTVRPELLPEDPKTLAPAYLGYPFITEDGGYNPEMKEKWKSFDYFDPRNDTNERYGREQIEKVLGAMAEVVRGLLGGEEG